jgi:DNA-binding transcriptional regulator YiaG
VIAGIVLMAGAKGLNGIAIGLFVAMVAAAVFGVIKLRSANEVKIEETLSAEDGEIVALRREIEVAEQTIAETENVTKEYLSRWDRACPDEMVLSELANLSAQMEEYEKLRERSKR